MLKCARTWRVLIADRCMAKTLSHICLSGRPAILQIDYEMNSIPDRLDCDYHGVLMATTGGPVSNAGTLTWNYAPVPGDPTWCLSS